MQALEEGTCQAPCGIRCWPLDFYLEVSCNTSHSTREADDEATPDLREGELFMNSPEDDPRAIPFALSAPKPPAPPGHVWCQVLGPPAQQHT